MKMHLSANYTGPTIMELDIQVPYDGLTFAFIQNAIKSIKMNETYFQQLSNIWLTILSIEI